jgi:AraC-like DNA-binding protein
MPAIPLPFVVALLLAILLIRVIVSSRTVFGPITCFIAASILLMITVGLRWSVDPPWMRFLRPVMAALLPPVAWLCYARLRQRKLQRIWPHFLMPAVILALSALWSRWHPPIDPILAVIYFGYGAALLRGAAAGSDQFETMRLTDADGTRRAVSTVGGLVLFSGSVDLLIAWDFYAHRGSEAVAIVAIANALALPVVAWAIAAIGRSVPDSEKPEPAEAPTGREPGDKTSDDALPPPGAAPATPLDRRIMDMVDAAMLSQHLYRDPDLTLGRLSRRIAIPSRQISNAINRIHGRNVSQVVNEYRIREAMRLLRETSLPVTAVMFECGFQTKSNFNREFARVTGTTPSDLRRSGAAEAETRKGSTV